MTFSAILLAVLFGATTAAVVILPLIERTASETPRLMGGTVHQNHALETLYAEKVRVLRSIRDIDFDYDMGKLAPEMYQAQRVQLVRVAVAIMKRIDDLEDQIAAQRVRLEALVEAYRQPEGRA